MFPSKNKSIPNTKSYIEFLRKTGHNVGTLVQAKQSTEDRYTNIDGNNRINAIVEYWAEPFKIYPEKLEDLMRCVEEEKLHFGPEQESVREQLREIFKGMSYPDFMNLQFHAYPPNGYFTNKHQEFWSKSLEKYRDAIEKHIKLIQHDFHLNCDNTQRFGQVRIPIRIFINYTMEELSTIFEEINKNYAPLTGEEIMASSLYDISAFKIEDSVLEASIKHNICEYYMERDEDEALEGYQFDEDTELNAYDLMTGLQKHCENTFNIKHSHGRSTSLPFLFKVYDYMYNKDGDISFSNMYTSDNVNEFLKYVMDFYSLLQNVQKLMFPESIDVKLFNDKCKKKLKQLSDNKMCLLLCAVIGELKNNTASSDIKKMVERVILYSFFVQDLLSNEKRRSTNQSQMQPTNNEDASVKNTNGKLFKQHDAFNVGDGAGELVKSEALRLLNREKQFGSAITPEVFENLLKEIICIDSCDVVDRRKKYKSQFYTCVLMSYYYKMHMPSALLNKTFSIEHVFPRSTTLTTPPVNIHRLGNTFPLIASINSKRGNRHIRQYDKNSEEEFITFVKDIIPNYDVYDSVVAHSDGKQPPEMHNTKKYNAHCEDVEQKYISNLLNCMF